MNRPILILRFGLLLLLTATLAARANESLDDQLRSIAADAKGRVSLALTVPGSPLHAELNPHARCPLQSVFKLPLALTILHQAELGKFRLNQPIHFRPEDRIAHAYSPLQEQYPTGGVDVPLDKLLQMTVALSDNVGADILLGLAGGAKAVDAYIASLGVQGFHLVDSERALHQQPALQYRNWFEPAGALQLLQRMTVSSPLNKEDSDLLLSWMRQAPLTTRLQGDLPEGVHIAHKTGSSDVVNGLAAATNDIGIIPLPNRKSLIMAVFVTDSTADDATRDKVIARLARAAYDAAIKGN